MYTIAATFLILYILFNYLQVKINDNVYTFTTITKSFPKPFNCGACISFWTILCLSLLTLDSISMVIIASSISFLSYQLLNKLL